MPRVADVAIGETCEALVAQIPENLDGHGPSAAEAQSAARSVPEPSPVCAPSTTAAARLVRRASSSRIVATSARDLRRCPLPGTLNATLDSASTIDSDRHPASRGCGHELDNRIGCCGLTTKMCYIMRSPSANRSITRLHPQRAVVTCTRHRSAYAGPSAEHVSRST